MRRLRAALLAVIVAATAHAQINPTPGLSGDFPSGTHISVSCPGLGEAPIVRVQVNAGYATGVRIQHAWTGSELWSAASYDSSATTVLQAVSAGDRREYWDLQLELPMPENEDTFAFNGDVVSVYLTVFDGDNDETATAVDLTIAGLPTVHHAIIKSRGTTIAGNVVYNAYVAAGADSFNYDAPYDTSTADLDMV